MADNKITVDAGEPGTDAAQANHGATLSCYDLPRDLIRCVKGLRQDLDVNPKYMEASGE